jgi:cytoskeletal protein CcmA (bactofilin family)
MGVVLAVAALALLAAFTAAGVSTMNLRVSTRVSNAAVAESLAESAVQEALARLQGDLGFDGAVEIGAGLGLPPGSRGFLSFDRDSPEPFSSNNFLGDHPHGWQRTVPDQTAHLIGVGESGGVRRCVEVVVHLPEFPVSMACDGPVLVTNSFIGAFQPADDRPWNPGTGYSVDDDELGPGHLVSNSESPDACVLDDHTRITGDLQARGGVHLNGAVVEGEVRAPWGQRAPVPDFNLADFDPKSNPNIHYEELPEVLAGLSLVGNVRRQGNLTLSGDLRLDNAFLFVDGDLTVQGAFHGVGAVVVTGVAKFEGAVDVQSDEQIALLSGGGLQARGEDADRAVFKGLLYTKGPFEARKITIVGGFIVDDGATARIADSKIFFNSTTISPAMKREVYAVVPRFEVPATTARPPVLFRDPTGFATGNWPITDPPRDVDNVLDKQDADWQRSAWAASDPAVVSVTWIDGQPLFHYRYWGLNPATGVELDDTSNRVGAFLNDQTFNSAEEMANSVAEENSNPDNAHYLEGRGSLPNRNAYKNYILKVAEHLTKAMDGQGGATFSMDPNEFITDAQQLRILYRRVF